MAIPLNVIGIFKYPLKLVKNNGKFTRTQRRNAGAFHASSDRHKIRLNKKMQRKTKTFSSVHNIFWRYFYLFDLCKLYHSLDMLIYILRWLKISHMNTCSVQ